MKGKAILLVLLVIISMVLAGCAAGGNRNESSPNQAGAVAGFWQGLWHGIIAPITFWISLLSNGVHFYEVYNNGNWYNFGFMLGLGISSGGSGTVGKKISQRRRQ